MSVMIGRNRQTSLTSGPTRLTQLNLQPARQTSKPHSTTALHRPSMDLLPHNTLLRTRPTGPGNTGSLALYPDPRTRSFRP